MIKFNRKSKWDKVSRHNPCPICGRADWCLTTGPADSPDAAICARVESEKRVGTKGAGWLHRLRDDEDWRDRPRQRRVVIGHSPSDDTPITSPTVEFLESMAAEFVLALDPVREQQISESLGVSAHSLNRLQMGWSKWHQAYSFPMRGPDGNPRGIRFRGADGKKWSLRGGHEGLFIPVNVPIVGTLLICEGPTDCAALLDLHFDVVARPSCSGGVGPLVDLICNWHPDDVAIIADSDAPGQRGARYLASRLVGYVAGGIRIVTPPAKDAREWMQKGANRLDVLDTIDVAPVLQLTYGVKGAAL